MDMAGVLEAEAGLSVVAALATWMSEGDDAGAAIADWLAHARQVGRGRQPGKAPSVAAMPWGTQYSRCRPMAWSMRSMWQWVRWWRMTAAR